MQDNRFFEYATMLLREAGHMITSDPVYVNHSSSEAMYIDSNKDAVISNADRTLLSSVENISLLMEVEWDSIINELTEKVQVFSVTVDFPKSSQSEDVADVHYLLQQYWSNSHSIVIFKNKEQFVFSFADDTKSHILSEWMEISDDIDEIIERLSIENMTLQTCDDYFEDFIYAIAREYYIHPISFENASYGMIPIDMLCPKATFDNEFVICDEVTKEDIKETIRANLSYYETIYGNDYVAARYDGMNDATAYRNISDEIERISFELDFEDEYAEEAQEAYDFTDDDEYEDEFIDDIEDFNSAIFDDPILMVKWLEKKQKMTEELDEKEDTHAHRQKAHLKAERKEQERLEAERREKARLEAERKEQERLEAERREKARLEAERKEQERLEAERREKARLEAERKEQERLEAERREKARLEAERKEQERLEAKRREKARLEAERKEQERLEAERREKARLEAERKEQERLEAERREKARLEAELKEQERLEAERREKARLEAERKEQERLEAERREKARLEAERKERERLEAERREKARLEAERKERERLEAERREKARLEAERKERERLEAERREKARLEAERKERERLEAEQRKKEQQRQRALSELSQRHDAELSTITQKCEADLTNVNSQIKDARQRLAEIEERLSKLGILQFIEKKKLKAEQDKLTEKLTKLNSLILEVKQNLERETEAENNLYREAVQRCESSFK